MLRLLRVVWVMPVTIVGWLVASLARASGGQARRVDGVLEVAGGLPARVLRRGFPFSGPVAAITLGHVVVGASPADLDLTRTHERAHVRQFERWGIFMLVLYPLASVVAWLRGGDPYRDNRFECEARRAENSVRVAEPMLRMNDVNRSAGGRRRSGRRYRDRSSR